MGGTLLLPAAKAASTALKAQFGQENAMGHVYKVVELVGSSTSSIEDAINTAISRASETLRNLRWFEVLHTRGHIEEGQTVHYQVTLRVGFTLEEG
jgi:flavin-binding protein dodecin